jgi:hypothetical protein
LNAQLLVTLTVAVVGATLEDTLLPLAAVNMARQCCMRLAKM